MYINRLRMKLFVIVSVLITGILLSVGLLIFARSQAPIALASNGVDSEKKADVNLPLKGTSIYPNLILPSVSLPITGVVIAPADAYSFSVAIYTAPIDVELVIISATATWSDDWHTPSLSETTQSYPNIVEIPYHGGVGCDYIYNYEENHFKSLWLDAQDQFSKATRRIQIEPGKSVAIAGSDCGLTDNFLAHYHIAWMAIKGKRIFIPNVSK